MLIKKSIPLCARHDNDGEPILFYFRLGGEWLNFYRCLATGLAQVLMYRSRAGTYPTVFSPNSNRRTFLVFLTYPTHAHHTHTTYSPRCRHHLTSSSPRPTSTVPFLSDFEKLPHYFLKAHLQQFALARAGFEPGPLGTVVRSHNRKAIEDPPNSIAI